MSQRGESGVGYKTGVNPTLPLYAGFWRRAGAALFDMLLLTLPNLAFRWLHGGDVDLWIDIALWTVVDGAYFAGFHASGWQATPGKRAFGIKVTDLRGARISFLRAVGRYLGTWLSALLLGVGYLMVAWTAQKQALHDKLAGTVVVNAGAVAQDITAGNGVMPLSTRTILAIVLLAVLMAGVSVASFHMNDKMTGGQPVKTVTPLAEERLSYGIYTFAFLTGERRLVAEGSRVYRHTEVLETHYPGGDTPFTRKVLPVAEGFELEAMIVPEARVEGFGLSIARDGGGFSWEWFTRESEDVFCKLQGPGRVRVRFAKVGDREQLAEVVFLDDITMRLDRYWLVPFREGRSDHLIVKKGSVLWLGD